MRIKLAGLVLPALLLVALAACGNDDNNGETAAPANGDDNAADDAPVEIHDDASGMDDDPLEGGEPPAAAADGSGTLEVDGITFEFDVVHCGFSPGETGNEDVPFSLRGEGVTPDGEPFEVDAVTVELDEVLSEGLEIWIGDSFPYDQVYETGRIQMDDMVSGIGDSEAFSTDLEWPLLHIDGTSVSAEAGFLRIDDYEEQQEGEFVGTGVFEAECS